MIPVFIVIRTHGSFMNKIHVKLHNYVSTHSDSIVANCDYRDWSRVEVGIIQIQVPIQLVYWEL